MTALALLVIFPFAMLYAAASDLVTMTIANRVSILLALAFPVVAYAAGMAPGAIGAHLGIGLVCVCSPDYASVMSSRLSEAGVRTRFIGEIQSGSGMARTIDALTW